MTQLDLIIQFCNDANDRNCMDKILYIKQAAERAKAEHAEYRDHALPYWEDRAAKAEAQNEWLKDRLAYLQLPAHMARHREEWLVDCGMPAITTEHEVK